MLFILSSDSDIRIFQLAFHFIPGSSIVRLNKKTKRVVRVFLSLVAIAQPKINENKIVSDVFLRLMNGDYI